MGHASCALGCSDQRGCSTWGPSRPQIVEVEVPESSLTSKPRKQAEAQCLESWHGAATVSPAPLDVKPVSHLAPLPTLQLDMPAAVAAAFLESTRAEADAKYRRKLACRAARAEAAGQAKELRGGIGLAASRDDKAVSPSPASQHRTFNMDGKFALFNTSLQSLQHPILDRITAVIGQARGDPLLVAKVTQAVPRAVGAQEWLCMARRLNASIARDNQELREHVVEAKRVLGRASSLPAGCGGMAAKVLREERVVLARRIAESPARARQIYRPLSMPSFIAEMKVATKRCGGAEDKKFSREPLFQDRLLSGRTSVKDAAVSADALNHRKGYENKQGGSSIAYDEVCEVRTTVQEVPDSEDLQPVLSHSLHELISDLCQPIKVDDTLHHGQDHPLSVETSEVCISNRHSRSGSVAELAVNACMFVVAHGVQNCLANGCDLANGGTCVYDMIDDTMQLTDITDCMEEKRAVAEAYAALARSSDRAAGVNEALPKAAGAGSPLAQSENEQSVLIAEVKALEDDTAVASLKQNLLAAADVAIATLAEEASEEPKQAEEMEAAKTAEEERLAKEAEEEAKKAEEERLANLAME
ncbi:FAZ1, partial [Symbiodinium necroappetens]